MKSAAIISKPDKAELGTIVPELLQWLQSREYTVYLDHETAAYVPHGTAVPRAAIAGCRPGFAIVLGGDGTLLSAARALSQQGIPILAVNVGSLGFLTEVTLPELYPTLEAVDRGECPVEARTMLHCQLQRGGQCIAEYEALNDAVITRAAISRMIGVDLFLEQSFVSTYKGDGIIISTPTGSTAYSLAAGGPILTPSVSGFVITPVCSHSLTHRPLVVRDSAMIEVVCGDIEPEAFLSIDGQVGMPVVPGDRVLCRKSQHQVKLLQMRKAFFEVLRTKLKWGQR
jgi:NAD+ kinase